MFLPILIHQIVLLQVMSVEILERDSSITDFPTNGNLSGFQKAKVASAESGGRNTTSGLHFSGNDFSGNLLADKRMLPPEKGRHR